MSLGSTPAWCSGSRRTSCRLNPSTRPHNPSHAPARVEAVHRKGQVGSFTILLFAHHSERICFPLHKGRGFGRHSNLQHYFTEDFAIEFQVAVVEGCLFALTEAWTDIVTFPADIEEFAATVERKDLITSL